MLNESQKLTVKVAVRRAREIGSEDAEIKKLAAGMNVSEDEIRSYADQTLGVASASQAGRESPAEPGRTTPTLDQTIAAAQRFAKHRGRREWTTKEVQQLEQLRGEGKGPAEIAKVLGCDVRRVQSKLHNIKKEKAQAQPAGESPAAANAISAPEDSAPDEKAETGGPTSGPLPEVESRSASDAPRENPLAGDDLPGPAPEYESLYEKLAEPETPNYPIDMPVALLQLMKLVRDNYGEDVVRVYASNDDHQAACAFQVDGTCYDLRLEVLE